MRSMRSVSTIFLVGVWLGGFSACSSVLLNTPVSKHADGWIVTLSQAKEGPDEYAAEGVAFTPEKGEMFIWTRLTVRSDLAEEQMFSYETCTLDEKGRVRQPVIVDRNEEVTSSADRSESFNPGQERTRLLIYRYPKDQRPTRMKCGTIVLPIPGRR
jgi:hypothetical protein